jgi:anti-sigma-K factor RskA
MSDLEDIDGLAAEYVIGTLTAAERVAVDARQGRDPVLAEAIAAWQTRLAPLNDATRAVPPPADMFQRIEAAVAGSQGHAQGRVSSLGSASADVINLQRRVKRWQWATVAASAMAASFALMAVFRDTILPPKPQSFVAAFVKDDQLPSFMLTIDLATRELTIRPVGAEKLAGKTYQLWIASDRLGPAPRSLGVLDDGSQPLQRKTLTDYDPNLLQTATFGVSIEAAGGSATGRPSAGALHAKLVPAKP